MIQFENLLLCKETGPASTLVLNTRFPRLFGIWMQIVFIWLGQRGRKEDATLAQYTWELQTQYDPDCKPRIIKPSHKRWDETGLRPTVAVFFSQMALETSVDAVMDSNANPDLNKFLAKHLY